MSQPINCTPSELSTYLQALAEGYLPISYLGTNPSAPSKSSHIASKFLRLGKRIVCFLGFPSLRMCGPLTAGPGAESLTPCAEGSPVRTSACAGLARDWTESEADFGARCFAWFAKWDRDSYSWKTPQCSLLGDSGGFSGTWPARGMMRGGACSELPTRARRIPGKGFGYWPTPKASDGNRGDCPSERARRSPSLVSAVKMWPTPTASDHRNRGNLASPSVQRRIEKGKQIGLSMAAGGQLNPTWVEWLMGWPLGLTDLKPLATDKFRQWLHSHGER